MAYSSIHLVALGLSWRRVAGLRQLLRNPVCTASRTGIDSQLGMRLIFDPWSDMPGARTQNWGGYNRHPNCETVRDASYGYRT